MIQIRNRHKSLKPSNLVLLNFALHQKRQNCVDDQQQTPILVDHRLNHLKLIRSPDLLSTFNSGLVRVPFKQILEQKSLDYDHRLKETVFVEGLSYDLFDGI